jgi:hypothetical protein
MLNNLKILIFIYFSISFAAQKYIFLCKSPSIFRKNLMKRKENSIDIE